MSAASRATVARAALRSLLPALLCLAALTPAGCVDNPRPWPPPAPNINLINANPALYMGQAVTVSGNVGHVYKPGVFSINDTIGGKLLVIVDAKASPSRVKLGDAVVISGVVAEFRPGMEMQWNAVAAPPAAPPSPPAGWSDTPTSLPTTRAASRPASGPAAKPSTRPANAPPAKTASAPAARPAGNVITRTLAAHEEHELIEHWRGRLVITAARISPPTPDPLP